MTTDTQGDTSSNYSMVGYANANASLTASASGALQSVGVNLQSAAGNICVAIYDDSGGKPNNLLGTSASQAAVAGWNDIAISGVSITQGQVYHLGYQIDNGGSYVYRSATSGTCYYKGEPYGTWPNPFSNPSSATTTWNMRMTYSSTVNKNVSDSGTGSESAVQPALPMSDVAAGTDVLSEREFQLPDSGLAVDAAIRNYTITGTVKDALGNPVAGATVWLFRTSDEVFIASTTSDANGVFVLPLSDQSTQYFIRAHLDSYQGSRVFGTTDRQLVAS